MAEAKVIKKSKKFSWFRAFPFKKREKSKTLTRCEPSAPPAEIETLDILYKPSAELSDLELSDLVTHTTRDHSDIRHTAATAVVSAEELDDNLMNEHIEELILRTKKEDDEVLKYQTAGDEIREPLHSNGDFYKQLSPNEIAVDSCVIPDGLCTDTLGSYTRACFCVVIFLLSPSAALLCAIACLVMLPTLRAQACTLASKAPAFASAAGISLHAVVWVLLASFANFYVAILYATLVLLYKLCLTVLEQISQAIAQILASIIIAVFIGPVIALFGVIFGAKSAPLSTYLPCAPPPQATSAGPGTRANRVSNAFEGLFSVFFLPLQLPHLLKHFQRTHHPQPPPQPPRTPFVLTANLARRRGGRGCDLCRLLFR